MTNITSTSLSSKRLSLVVCLRLPPLINRLFIPFSLSLFSPSKNSTCDLAQYSSFHLIVRSRKSLQIVALDQMGSQILQYLQKLLKTLALYLTYYIFCNTMT